MMTALYTAFSQEKENISVLSFFNDLAESPLLTSKNDVAERKYPKLLEYIKQRGKLQDIVLECDNQDTICDIFNLGDAFDHLDMKKWWKFYKKIKANEKHEYFDKSYFGYYFNLVDIKQEDKYFPSMPKFSIEKCNALDGCNVNFYVKENSLNVSYNYKNKKMSASIDAGVGSNIIKTETASILNAKVFEGINFPVQMAYDDKIYDMKFGFIPTIKVGKNLIENLPVMIGGHRDVFGLNFILSTKDIFLNENKSKQKKCFSYIYESFDPLSMNPLLVLPLTYQYAVEYVGIDTGLPFNFLQKKLENHAFPFSRHYATYPQQFSIPLSIVPVHIQGRDNIGYESIAGIYPSLGYKVNTVMGLVELKKFSVVKDKEYNMQCLAKY